MCSRRRGFSVIEMLIVLAVLAGLIAVIAPIGVNTLRKSHAVSVAKDLKTLSSVFSSKIYLDGGVPVVIGELGRNVDGRSFGAAWKKNDDG
ncbi:MAG TPA: prepilin-type N-terminal cleavage/methylation domain-containing protein, partial [Mesotoga prima]|nr:prepilin-type N-terminal cleavage/methylation domain-containing protein [Mesotoga prima]